MKERPIIMQPESVRAIIDLRKTESRRTAGLDEINADPDAWEVRAGMPGDEQGFTFYSRDLRVEGPVYIRCPYGVPGDRLYVKEPWAGLDREFRPFVNPVVTGIVSYQRTLRHAVQHKGAMVVYRADHDTDSDGPDVIEWRNALFMPRWASRLTLELLDVKVQRLQDISNDECRAEGRPAHLADVPLIWFSGLWDSINGKPRKGKPDVSWVANPWVWVLTFRQVIL